LICPALRAELAGYALALEAVGLLIEIFRHVQPGLPDGGASRTFSEFAVPSREIAQLLSFRRDSRSLKSRWGERIGVSRASLGALLSNLAGTTSPIFYLDQFGKPRRALTLPEVNRTASRPSQRRF